MIRNRLLCPLLVLTTAVLLLSGCGGRDRAASSGAGGGKILVYTTVYPLYDFTRNIGGDRVEVHNVLPPGADPHHWEPSPGDMVNITRSRVFIYCGAGLESWAESVLKNTDRGKTVIVDSSRGVDLISEGPGHNQDHSGSDPHIWLDPANAAIMVDNILEGLAGADPAGSDYYRSNAARYRARLADLDSRYGKTLSGARVRQFVVSHAAFGYLARRYGLEQVPIRGLTADVEPGPARMAEIVELVRERGIKYIFFEPLVSPRVTQAIARETGAGTLVLNTIAALSDEEIKGGKDYLSLMEENLKNLAAACEAGDR